MAGIEIAGLVFGVVPIVVETLKSYSFVREKLHTCRHYSDEVEEVAARLSSSRTNFNNEIQLLRRCLKDKEPARDIGDDADHALQESYRSCLKTVERTKKILDKMDGEMGKFDELLTKKSQGHSIKRLRSIIKIAFNESKYERFLNRLRERNDELSTFRLQIEALKKPETRPVGICVQHKPLPARFCAVQLASRQLHAALQEAWYCSDAVQRGHHAKLCLDAEVVDEVRLDLAISCQGLRSGAEPSNSTKHTHIWLYVQSTTVSDQMDPEITATQISSDLQNLQSVNCGSPHGRTAKVKKKASSDLSSQSMRRKRVKRVQWAVLPGVDSVPESASYDLVDLRQTKNICDFLRRSYLARHVSHGPHCVGYLQDSYLYKHSFFFRENSISPELNGHVGSKIHSIEDVLKQSVHDVIGIIDQLRIAHKLAIAVLQYNGTPWLPHHWRLIDLKYLGTNTTMDASALRTLHLSSEITRQPDTSKMDGIRLAKDAVTNEIRQGITNPTLFCLGVALLEIAYWTPIEAKMTKNDESNPVLTARRLQKDRMPPLGLEYQSIAKRCLWCDFGFGNQLSEKGLQSAVYTNVVWELEELIAKFTKLGVK